MNGSGLMKEFQWCRRRTHDGCVVRMGLNGQGGMGGYHDATLSLVTREQVLVPPTACLGYEGNTDYFD